eukprot:g113.t1
MSASFVSVSSSTRGRRSSWGRLETRNFLRHTVPRKAPQDNFSLCRKRYTLTPRSVATDKASTGKSESANKKNNEVKKNLDTAITSEVAKSLYRDMVMGRDFEERCAEMYYRGKMFGYVSMFLMIISYFLDNSFVHLYSGQEAVSTGVIKCLRPDDYVCSTYRDHVHAISKGVSPNEVMAELFGKKTGVCRGQGGSMHIFSSPHNFVYPSLCLLPEFIAVCVVKLGGFAFIGEGIPVGLGAAFQIKYRKDVLLEESADQVTCSFFGDGTCNNGQFYECLNMASLYNLPHIFVVENNLWAIGMNHNRATSRTAGDKIPYIYKKGPAFGMPGVLVDGMDVVKVREVALEAIERARNGGGPTLIECETYRYRGHSLADPDELRSQEEKAHYQKRDPIPAFRKEMTTKGILKSADFEAIDKEVEKAIDNAVEFADKSPKPDKGQLLENVFADPRGFGVAEDGNYRYEQAGFTSGNMQVS